jgi:hypothetical protein
MKRFWGVALGLAVTVGVCAGEPPETAPTPKTSAEVLAQLKKQVGDSYDRAIEPLRKAQQTEDEAEKKALRAEFDTLYQPHLKFDAECRAKAAVIAKAEPKTETGLDAAVWAAQGLRAAAVDEAGKTKAELEAERKKAAERATAERAELVAIVIAHHLTSEKVKGVIGLVANQANTDPKALDTLELIADRNPHKPVQAAAVLAVAEFYKDKAEPYGKKPPADADTWLKKAEATFERVLKAYPDEIQYAKRTYGEAATASLYELRNLSVGKVVPEIEGEDMDGAKFKLSDYRGKVVMLDFWGHW